MDKGTAMADHLREATPADVALPSDEMSPGPEAIDRLSDLYAEPDWMRQARHDAWNLYQSMAPPHETEEAWRRTNPKQYPLDSVRLTFAQQELDNIHDLPSCWDHALAPVEQVSGVLLHCNAAQSFATMRHDDAKNGVVLDGLHHALQTHSDLIKQHWMKGAIARPDFNAYTALNAALWHGGTFVHIPAGKQVARPLQSLVAYDTEGGTGLHHTLMIAERGSRVTLIQDRVSQDLQREANIEVVEIYAEAGTWVRYVSLQHWSEHRYTVSIQESQVNRDANFVWVTGAVGGAMTKEFLRTDLRERGARAVVAGFNFMGGNQHIDQSTYQHHRAPYTHSDLLIRNVLRGNARTVFYGMIRVENEANGGTEGYQTNNNLLLDDAHAHAIPGLEILANDVRCSHGATVSRIDQEERFYLQARGLPKPEAESLIVLGFVRPVIERIPTAHVRQRLEDKVMERFWE